MIIDKDGNTYSSWWSGTGPLIEDKENKYGILFKIGMFYTKEQTRQHLRIDELKRNLAASDYRVMKYADGEYTAEQYEPYRLQRAAWRAEINEIEKNFVEPTLTREEIERAIENAALSIKKKIAEETGLKIEEIKLGEET